MSRPTAIGQLRRSINSSSHGPTRKSFGTWDIAKFISFAQFYSAYIHHFELRITPLREITIKSEYTDSVGPLWSDAAQRSMTT